MVNYWRLTFNAPRQAKPSQCHNNTNDGCCLIYETQFVILFSNSSNISTNLDIDIYINITHIWIPSIFYFIIIVLFCDLLCCFGFRLFMVLHLLIFGCTSNNFTVHKSETAKKSCAKIKLNTGNMCSCWIECVPLHISSNGKKQRKRMWKVVANYYFFSLTLTLSLSLSSECMMCYFHM